MAAPADSSTTATTTASHDEASVVKTTTKPLPRAIEMVMTISFRLEPSSTSASTKTLGEHDWAGRFLSWMKLVFLSPMCIATAVFLIYAILHDDDDDDEVISGAGGFVFLAVLFLPLVYMAVVLAASGHLDLFAPQTPYAAWDPLYKVGFKGMGPPVIFTSFGATMLYTLMPDQAWLLLACAYLLGLLVASTIAYWLCLLRTYGGGRGGERREKNNCCGEAVIDGLAYLYGRLLYEYAVRFLADADAGMQQLDTDI